MDERRSKVRSRKSDLFFAGALAAALAIPLALVAVVASGFSDEIRSIRSAADGVTWTVRITVSL